MNHASLAARYRPQTFADVTGQDTVKAILSRAAAEDRVAPAYLLSGTRGVGKTTIARVFAKALNCVNAPTAEPCNVCEACKRITQGAHVDVVEIDGASNRGIDDARRLRDAIGYAPLEGRYKVFIIDEAHMLTRDAFNALLKTLEEPPARATFILATTEPHKFPVTIISRCQHFIFKAIPEAGLVGHLSRVLQREGLAFDENAVRLLARRAAGSVRDSMSLLGQTLALGGESLTEHSVRDVLGLAGQEMFERLLLAVNAQDCLGMSRLTRELLERGVDLGFFLRELAQLWRNLFLLRQSGEAALSVVDLPEAESRRLLELSAGFEPSVIHAAWQLVLEGQRQVLTSLEPASALELLLLNLALLPRLAGLEALRPQTTPPPPILTVQPSAGGTLPSQTPQMNAGTPPVTASMAAPASATSQTVASPARESAARTARSEPEPADAEPEPAAAVRAESPQQTAGTPNWPCDWDAFLAHCDSNLTADGAVNPLHLHRVRGTCTATELSIEVDTRFEYDRLNTMAARECLRRMAVSLAGGPVTVVLNEPPAVITEKARREAAAQHPAVRVLTENFDASVERCVPLDSIS